MIVDTSANIPLASLSALFVSVFVIGTMLTFGLYKFDLERFVRSSVFIKILFWWPIFALFVASLFLVTGGKVLAITLIVALAARELHARLAGKRYAVANWYFLGYSLALSHYFLFDPVFPDRATNLLIIISFSSVVSDVTAYFTGNFWGRHKLPAWLNSRKSWEGVAGQIIGSLLGVFLIREFVVSWTPISLFLPIGLGSMAGDLVNSYVKRRLQIKDWSNSIPGHGGFLDRFSSLSFGLAFTFYWVLAGL